MEKMRKVICLLAVVFALWACGGQSIEIVEFDPMANFPAGDTVRVEMQLDEAPFEGVVLPRKGEMFHLCAKVKNPENKTFYYKIYYQNASYKFDEARAESQENFYGSWQECETGFKPLSGESIADSFCIVGNPRDEKIYYGIDTPGKITEERLQKDMNAIRRDENWLNDIRRKAKENKMSLEEQLAADALWLYDYNCGQQGEKNRRERRNPRTGAYEFMLVVADSAALGAMPEWIKDISKTDSSGRFVNPFSYFTKKRKGVSVAHSKRMLVARAVLDGRNGVYIDRLHYPKADFAVHNADTMVGTADFLYLNAIFEQFFHDINRGRTIKQVPIIADVAGGEYTLEDYKAAKRQYSSDASRIMMHPTNTDRPGLGVKLASDRSYIEIINPKSTSISSARKENVGIRARVGFAYGKYRAKIKFPRLVNSHGVWTGLTNAFWLVYQSEREWNARRACGGKGYVKHSKDEQEAERMPRTNYSEIDIEMIKTSKLWTDKNPKGYQPFGSREFVLACTNWDLACPEPKNFNKGGLQQILYKGQRFELHRWSETYRALTSRIGLDASLFDSDFYYYEIEWKPTEIIWRVGPSPDKMQIVGYMNESVTSIPNNQMNVIVTQEFHYSDWWLPELYEQGLIPFAKEDLKGRIYEITIE